MESIRIQQVNGKELIFEGDLIANAGTETASVAQLERWFQLRVYRNVDGGFVPSIEFGSPTESEASATIAEFVDSYHDIENFFFVFEPSEVFSGRYLNSMMQVDRQRLLGELLSQYDQLVNSVLLQLRRHRLGQETVEAAESKKKKGLLGYLGL